MAADPDRPNDGAWTDIERGFFASAPPDVPEPPPEPMRFDDLDPIAPIAPPRPAWRARLGRARAKLSAVSAIAARRAALVLAAAARITAREGRARVAVLLAAFRGRSRNRRLIAAAAAALIVVTGVSAGVVASRGSGRATPHDARLAAGAGGPVLCEAAPAPADAVTASAQDAPPSTGSIAPEAAPAPHRKRKHAKSPARHSVRAKPAVASRASVTMNRRSP